MKGKIYDKLEADVQKLEDKYGYELIAKFFYLNYFKVSKRQE